MTGVYCTLLFLFISIPSLSSYLSNKPTCKKKNLNKNTPSPRNEFGWHSSEGCCYLFRIHRAKMSFQCPVPSPLNLSVLQPTSLDVHVPQTSPVDKTLCHVFFRTAHIYPQVGQTVIHQQPFLTVIRRKVLSQLRRGCRDFFGQF